MEINDIIEEKGVVNSEIQKWGGQRLREEYRKAVVYFTNYVFTFRSRSRLSIFGFGLVNFERNL